MCLVLYVDFKNKALLKKQTLDSITVENKLNKEKLDYFHSLIDGGLTQVIVNGHIDKVLLPKNMISNFAIPINWSHKFNIKDFQYDSLGVRGTLSFNKKPYFVNLPWESIWLIHRPDNNKLSKIWKAEAPDGFDLSSFTDN